MSYFEKQIYCVNCEKSIQISCYNRHNHCHYTDINGVNCGNLCINEHKRRKGKNVRCNESCGKCPNHCTTIQKDGTECGLIIGSHFHCDKCNGNATKEGYCLDDCPTSDFGD
jgi:hypothetical protein